MKEPAYKGEIERFIAYFGDPVNLSRLKGAETGDEAWAALTDCPAGALVGLAVLLKPPPDFVAKTEKEGLGDLVAKARGVFDGLSPLLPKLVTATIIAAAEQQKTAEPRQVEVSFRSVFAVKEKRVEVIWRAREAGGQEHSSTQPPEVFLQAFVQLGQSIKAGWEGMRGMGWSMDSVQALAYSGLLKACAKTVEELSLLIPWRP